MNVQARSAYTEPNPHDPRQHARERCAKARRVVSGSRLQSLSGSRRERLTAPVHLIAAHLHLLFRWADVANLAKALALALDGKQFDAGNRMPLTPFPDDEAKIAEEQVSLDQVRQFVGLDADALSTQNTEPSK